LKERGFPGAEIRCKNHGMIYGYARVSTDGQSVDAQVRQLSNAGCKKVFREVASGAKTERAQLRRVLAQIAAGASPEQAEKAVEMVYIEEEQRLAAEQRYLDWVRGVGGEPAQQSPSARPSQHGREA
jgi:predicted site-specific integrase-resolvase